MALWPWDILQLLFQIKQKWQVNLEKNANALEVMTNQWLTNENQKATNAESLKWKMEMLETLSLV